MGEAIEVRGVFQHQCWLMIRMVALARSEWTATLDPQLKALDKMALTLSQKGIEVV